MRSFSRIVLLVFLSVLVSQPLLAIQKDDHRQWDFLINRQHNWPNWKVPTFFISSDLKEELHYPYWFQGLWNVESVDLDSQKETSIQHLARFKIDDSQNIVPDRFFNANSIAQEVFGKKFLENRRGKMQNPSHRSSTIFSFFVNRLFFEDWAW